MITFALPRPMRVRLSVVDAAGDVLVTLVDATSPEGPASIVLDTDRLPCGIHFIRLDYGGSTETRSVEIVR